MRVKITLACTECKQRNYNTTKNKKNDPDRLEMKQVLTASSPQSYTVHRGNQITETIVSYTTRRFAVARTKS